MMTRTENPGPPRDAPPEEVLDADCDCERDEPCSGVDVCGGPAYGHPYICNGLRSKPRCPECVYEQAEGNY